MVGIAPSRRLECRVSGELAVLVQTDVHTTPLATDQRLPRSKCCYRYTEDEMRFRRLYTVGENVVVPLGLPRICNCVRVRTERGGAQLLVAAVNIAPPPMCMELELSCTW